MGVVLLHKISCVSVALVVFASISRATRGVRGDKEKQKHANLDDLPEEVHVTICTDSLADERSNTLMERVKLLGYTPHWLNCSDAFENKTNPQWGRRLQHYQKFVEDILQSSDDDSEIHHDPLIIFVDAMDVLAEGTASEALARFDAYGTPVVLSCVSYQYPFNTKDCEAYARLNVSGYCAFPSGGAYMGRATGLRKLFRDGGKFHSRTDDQCWLFSAAYEHLKPNEDYKLDTASKLFLSYTNKQTWLWSYSLEQGRHKVHITDVDSSPTFIHLDSSHARTEVMKKLGECLPGSLNPTCNRRVGGYWPQPRDLRWVVQAAVALLPVAPILVFIVALCMLERNCSKRWRCRANEDGVGLVQKERT